MKIRVIMTSRKHELTPLYVSPSLCQLAERGGDKGSVKKIPPRYGVERGKFFSPVNHKVRKVKELLLNPLRPLRKPFAPSAVYFFFLNNLILLSVTLQ